MSTILKIFVFPAAMLVMCLGVLTILGGHITPGGGFQGGAMIAAGFIFCLIVYGLKESHSIFHTIFFRQLKVSEP